MTFTSSRFVRALGTAALAAAVAGCSPGARVPVSAPAGVRAAASLDATHILLLSGEGSVRTVHVVRATDGTEEIKFGVAPEITSIGALSPHGPLVLGFGIQGTHPVGALELWSLDGKKTGSYPLPIAALDVTRPIGGTFYVLLGNGVVRAAQRVQTNPLRIDPHPIPLPGNSAHLRLCAFRGTKYLLSSGGSGKITLTNPANRKSAVSEVLADEAECVDGRDDLYGLLHVTDPGAPMARDAPENQLLQITLPSLLQAQIFPAPRDAVAIVPTGPGHLVEVASSEEKSTLRIIDVDTLGQK